MLLRSEFLVIGTLLLASVGVMGVLRLKEQRFAGYSALGCVIAFLIISPWIARNYQVFGKFVPIVSRPWFEIWRGHNPYATGAEWKKNGLERASVLADTLYSPITRTFDKLPFDNTFELRANDILKQEALSFMRSYPAETLALAGKKVLFLWVHDLYNPQSQNLMYFGSMILVSFLIWCGFVALWRRGGAIKSPITLLYAAYMLMYTGIFALTFVLPRYRIYVFVGLLPLTGLGLIRLFGNTARVPER
jgi:hypothetical protein